LGWGCVAEIGAREGVGSPWVESRGGGGGAKFFTSVQTGPGNGSFPWVKFPGRWVNQPLLSSADVKERVELCLYSPSVPSWQVIG